MIRKNWDCDLEIERLKYNKTTCIRNRSAIIAAVHIPTYGIGNNGDLLFKIREDLKHFMNITKNNIVVMGKGTWNSLPKKPLKNRHNIILSYSGIDKLKKEISDNKYTDTVVINGFKDLLVYLKSYDRLKKIFYIGGETVYKEAMQNDLIDAMYITEKKSDIEPTVDKYFNYSANTEYSIDSISEPKREDGYEYVFKKYIRNI